MVSQVLRRVLSRLNNVKTLLRGWGSRCPAHQDHENSLAINEGEDGKVLLKCFAGCSVRDIVESIGMGFKDLFPRKSGSQTHFPLKGGKRIALTIEKLAFDKALPPEFLNRLGLVNRKTGVVIPYRKEDGSLAARQRLRTALSANKGSYWLPGEGSPSLYGLEKLKEARQGGSILFTEGESDCWTLWFHGFHARFPPETRIDRLRARDRTWRFAPCSRCGTRRGYRAVNGRRVPNLSRF